MSWEEAGGAGNARKGYCRFGQVLGRDKGFLVVTEFLVLCRDMVLKLQAIAWSRHCIFMSRQCLLLCRDNVVTEVFVSWPSPFMLQHVGLGRDFSIATEYFCVTIEFGQGQEFLCRDRVFLCRDRVWP